MTRARHPLFALLIFMLAQHLPAFATYHVFVRTPEGVWLASDTLRFHNDGLKVTKSVFCKAVLSKARIIFNAGKFRNLPGVQNAEAKLPMADSVSTEHALSGLLIDQHQDVVRNAYDRANLMDVFAWVIQIHGNQFEGYGIGQTQSGTTRDHYVEPPFAQGIPHDLGQGRLTHSDLAPSRRRAFLRNPRGELLKIMRRVASSDQTVAGPYTVLLLRNDGTIADVSKPDARGICSVPREASQRRRSEEMTRR